MFVPSGFIIKTKVCYSMPMDTERNVNAIRSRCNRLWWPLTRFINDIIKTDHSVHKINLHGPGPGYGCDYHKEINMQGDILTRGTLSPSTPVEVNVPKNIMSTSTDE